ncbi:MAG: S8 family serine peptidase [Clostridiales bacterium]|nr:S8 family serine peptidase [Clostridiales bacterium]
MWIKRNLKKNSTFTIILAMVLIIPFLIVSRKQVKDGNDIERDMDSELIYLLNDMSWNKRLSPIQLMFITDDTYSSNQWAIHNPGFYKLFTSRGVREVSSTVDLDMDVLEAWEHMKGENVNRRKVVVAIIDTGIDYLHPDLADNIWVNEGEIPGDGIDNDMNGYVDDVYGWDFYNDDPSVCHYQFDKKTNTNLSLPQDNDDHGTHIAGIIGAIADNKIGIAGIASNIDIELMVLKINGGSEGSGSISDAIDAIRYATMMGADICNISWGTSQYSPALEQAIKESDMLFVAAAGNMGSNNDNKPVYPASFKLDNLISVTFIDANGGLTKLSNYGKGSVEIAAPGTDILSTAVGSYQTLSGSSMAAPQVSAIASLLYSYGENIYPSNIKDILIDTLKPISTLEDRIIYPGIPSAYEAVLAIKHIKQDFVPPTIQLDTIYDKENLMIPIKVVDKGGAGVRTIRWLSGERKVEDFNRGKAGVAVENNLIKASKAGTYTVYASDYAGNESIVVYEVEDDTRPPIISSGYSVSEDYSTRTVNIRVYDSQSGIKRVKYLEGERKASDFLPADAGTVIALEDSRGVFDVKKDGIYTLYAIDHRGNQIVKTIDIRTILSEDLRLIRSEKTMIVGEEYNLRAFIKPVDTTDVIKYSSSNDKVVKVNNKGKITALSEGVVTITARTNNGYKAVCRVVVKGS